MYIPHTEAERREMLAAIGVDSIADLFADIPVEVKLKRPLNIPGFKNEMEVAAHLRELAARNASLQDYVSFLGAGVYDHHIPAAVDHILLRSEFYTAYTPYQPEISQGTLTAIFEFQTLICQLTGMETANASMYDGATATAEAALMGCAATRRPRILISSTVHPEYRAVVKTYARGQGLEVVEIPYEDGVTSLAALQEKLDTLAGVVIVQQPNFFGCLEPGAKISEIAKQAGAKFVVVADPVSLGLLTPPGEYGADIVVGDGQPWGNPPSFGGPSFGFMAVKGDMVRRMPGRIVGQTVDNRGQRAFVLTLQAREQHIRREKATSNICSNQALCALAATIHLSLLGKQGIRKVAELNVQKAHYLFEEMKKLPGFQPAFQAPFFREFAIKTPVSPRVINEKLLAHKFIGGLDLERVYPELANIQLWTATEKRTKAEMDRLIAALGEVK